MEYYSLEDNRMNRNRFLYINLGIYFFSSYYLGDGVYFNGGRILVYSLSDGYIDS